MIIKLWYDFYLALQKKKQSEELEFNSCFNTSPNGASRLNFRRWFPSESLTKRNGEGFNINSWQTKLSGTSKQGFKMLICAKDFSNNIFCGARARGKHLLENQHPDEDRLVIYTRKHSGWVNKPFVFFRSDMKPFFGVLCCLVFSKSHLHKGFEDTKSFTHCIMLPVTRHKQANNKVKNSFWGMFVHYCLVYLRQLERRMESRAGRSELSSW